MTDCPYTTAPVVTTETIAYSTTICPVTATPTPTEYTTSTLYTTTTYTISSCPSIVTDCPYTTAPVVTTEVIAYTTTVCPVTPSPTPSYTSAYYPQYTTSTLYTTKIYTISSCKAEVTDCPYATHPVVTTEVIPYTTTVCPVTDSWAPAPTGIVTTQTYGTGVPTKVAETTGVLPVTAAAGRVDLGRGVGMMMGVVAAAMMV